MNKYPDSPQTFVLKTDLLRRGAILTEEAGKRIEELYVTNGRWGAFHWSPELYQQEHAQIAADFYFNDLTHVHLVIGRPERDPYSLDYIEGEFWITSDGEKMEEIHFPQEPKYCGVTTSTGISMEHLVHRMGSDGLLLVPFEHCVYWENKNQCLFCDYDFNWKRAKKIDPQSRIQLDFQGIYEATKEALKERGRWRRILITGGSDPNRNYEREFEAYCKVVESIARAVKESCPDRGDPPPIYLVASPIGEVQLIAYKDAGVSAFGTYFETWDPEHFKLGCPGKQKFMGRDHFLDMALKAVDIFGEGNSIAGFVVGAEMAPPPYGFSDMEEALDSTLSGYEYLIKNKIVPQGTIWSIRPGHAFHRMKAKQPPLEFYVRLDRGRIDLLRKYWNGRLSADAMGYAYQPIGTYCDWQRLLLDNWEDDNDLIAQ